MVRFHETLYNCTILHCQLPRTVVNNGDASSINPPVGQGSMKAADTR